MDKSKVVGKVIVKKVKKILFVKGTNLCPSDTIVDAIAPPVTPA